MSTVMHEIKFASLEAFTYLHRKLLYVVHKSSSGSHNVILMVGINLKNAALLNNGKVMFKVLMWILEIIKVSGTGRCAKVIDGPITKGSKVQERSQSDCSG